MTNKDLLMRVDSELHQLGVQSSLGEYEYQEYDFDLLMSRLGEFWTKLNAQLAPFALVLHLPLAEAWFYPFLACRQLSKQEQERVATLACPPKIGPAEMGVSG